MKSIALVKLTMFWLPDLFTVVSKLKRAFNEAWKIMVLIFLFCKCYWMDGFYGNKMVWQK